MDSEAGSGFSRWTMTSPTWLDATISKSAGAGRTAMTRCRMFYGYYTTRELFAYVQAFTQAFMQAFIYSFLHPTICSVRSSIRSFIRSLICSVN
jgi:hypothetical protein